METQPTVPSTDELKKTLKQQFPEASDQEVSQAVSMGLGLGKLQGEFLQAAATTASAAEGVAGMGLDTSKFFQNYGDCDAKAKGIRDAAIAAAQAIPNLIAKMAAVVAANAAYGYAQGVCRRMYPNG